MTGGIPLFGPQRAPPRGGPARVLTPVGPRSHKRQMITYAVGEPKWRLSVWRALADEFSNDERPLAGVVWSSSYFAFQDEAPGEPKLAGFCLVAADGYVTYLFVRERFRKRGIGTALLERSHAAKWLTCVPEMEAYYMARGFVASSAPAHIEGMIRLQRQSA